MDATTLETLDAGTRAFQQTLAADGFLDRDEYVQLAQAYRQCVLEAGGELTEASTETAYGTFYFEVRFSEGGGPLIQQCTTEFWEPLAPLWSSGHQPTRQQIQAANDALGACLRRQGVDFPYEHPTGDQFTNFLAAGDATPAVLDCVREVSAEHRLPNFAGG